MPKTYRKDALIVFLLLAFIFAFFYQDGYWNGNSRFGLIFASVQEKRLSIDDYFDKPGTATGDLSTYGGHYYSDKAIGTAIIGDAFYLPIYWLQQVFQHPSEDTTKVILTFLVIGLPSAIAGMLMFLLCLYLSRSRFRAFLVTLSIMLGTMALPYSVTFFSHQLTASLLFSAFFMIFFIKESTKIRKNWYLFLIGLLLGWAIICEYPSAMIVLALVIYYLFVVLRNRSYRQWRAFLWPVIGGLIPIVIQLVYNKLCFGSMFSIGYSNLESQYFSTSMKQGIAGILWPNLQVLYFTTIHPTMGLFWQSPVLLLAIVGAVFMFMQRRYRAEAILATCIIFVYVVVLSGYYMWWGGYALGPRHLIPILPFFCLFLVFVPKKLNWPFVGLGIISIGQMLIAAASTVQVPDTMIAKLSSMPFFGYSNIYSFCWQQLVNNGFGDNLGHRFLHLRSWETLIPLAVVMVALILVFFWNEIWHRKTTLAVSQK